MKSDAAKVKVLTFLPAFATVVALGASAGAATPPPGCQLVGTLPHPQVAISMLKIGEVTADEMELMTPRLAVDLRSLSPGVDFVTAEELAIMLSILRGSELMGKDTEEQREGVQKLVGSQFNLTVTYSRVVGKAYVRASITDLDGNMVTSVQVGPESDFSPGMVDSVAQQLTAGGLLALLRSEQDLPILPTLCLQLATVGGTPPGGFSGDVLPDGHVRATATLLDADGSVYSGREVTVTRTIVGSRDAVTLLTDGNGQVTDDFPAGSSIAGSVGTVNASYRTTQANEKAYHIFSPSALTLTSPDAALTTGTAEPVSVSLRENGAPVSGARIDLAPQDGSLSANSVVTGADGKASVTMTMGDVGLAQVAATAPPPGQSPISPLADAPAAALSFVVEPRARLTLEAGATDIETQSATPVDLTVEVGGARIAGIPVVFSGGDLSVTQTQTDEFGQAETFFAAPASGSGSAAITAQATVQETIFSKSVTIGYHDGNAMTGKALPSIFSPPYATSVATPNEALGMFNCTTMGGSFTFKWTSHGFCDNGPLGSTTPLPVSLSSTGVGGSSVHLTVKPNGANAIVLDGSATVGEAHFVLELNFSAAGQLAFHAAVSAVGSNSDLVILGPNPTAFALPFLLQVDTSTVPRHDVVVPIPGPGTRTFFFSMITNNGTWHADITFTPSP